MSQSWTDNVYQSDHVGQTDLQNMENNFAALKSLFSGASQPASMAACHPWFDTAKHVLKIRDDANSAWLGLMHGDTNYRIWVYVNAAINGWAVVTTGECVLGTKGGDVYTTGGVTAGTWTQPNHTHSGPSHTHDIAAHGHRYMYGYTDQAKTYNANGESVDINDIVYGGGVKNVVTQTAGTGFDGGYTSKPSLQTDAGGTQATGGGATANTWRPYAYVGTLQKLDL